MTPDTAQLFATKHRKFGRPIADYIDASGDCWEWTGNVSSAGYGRVGIRGRYLLAHRVIWKALVGPIPVGLQIDHLCRNTTCVNPDHLEPVTHTVNLRRGSSANGRKTHCKNGHPFNRKNTYIDPTNGGRQCVKAHSAAYRQRKRQL